MNVSTNIDGVEQIPLTTTNTDNFTIHFRPVGRCNADCSYCSATNAPSLPMSLSTALDFADFLPSWFERIGSHPTTINICYLGGELLVMRYDELEAIVFAMRKRLREHGFPVIDSAQTNLVGSRNRINRLLSLFDGRVGTSIDNHSDQRTIAGDSQLFSSVFNSNHAEFLVDGRPLGSVVVVDPLNVVHLSDEVFRANRRNYSLTLRPVFGNWTFTDDPLSDGMLITGFNDAFDAWLFKSRITVEPFYSLFLRRLRDAHGVSDLEICHQSCPFKSDCVSGSIHIEPDGALFLCQPLADNNVGKIGSVGEPINDLTVSRLSKRSDKLHSDCQSCDYLESCSGGCMVRNSGIYDQDYYGKDRYCEVWKTLFAKMDVAVDKLGLTPVVTWLRALGLNNHG